MLARFLWISLCFLSVECFPKESSIPIDGTVADGWQFIRDLFEQNFVEERDLGASISVYHQGRLVVDLWGGYFDHSKTTLYDNNTLQLVFSTTKGVVAIAAALCVQNGLLNYSELVTKYWPEYGQNGKENTTVADILSHRAGLPLGPDLTEAMFNWTLMVQSLEEQKPLWIPGQAHSYHALTYGWLAGELIRRVDPKQRTLGQFVQEEIANRLNIEFYIGLPFEEANRVSPLTVDSQTLQTLNESTKSFYYFFNNYRLHQAEIPAANGITNARSLAKLYASLIMNLDDEENHEQLFDRNILEQAIKSNTPDGELDFLSKVPTSFAMGFMLLDRAFPYFQSTIFGHPGAGGSIAFAIPDKNLSFAYATNQLDLDAPYGTYPRVETILEAIATKINNDN